MGAPQDPELGRYLSEDPIGVAGGVARYGYVHDPMGWVDWWGLTGAYMFQFDTGEVYIGKGPESRFKQSQAIRSGQLPGSAIAKAAHLDFSSDRIGLMVEAELMRRYGFPSSNLLNAAAAPGKALLETATGGERRRVGVVDERLERKAGIGCK